uniref:Chondroitin sulfate proteoglycan 5 n=1 Tax=Sphenodon punctatus TaxID=8508 RepID=A0A8D0HKA1_SPHPU
MLPHRRGGGIDQGAGQSGGSPPPLSPLPPAAGVSIYVLLPLLLLLLAASRCGGRWGWRRRQQSGWGSPGPGRPVLRIPAPPAPCPAAWGAEPSRGGCCCYSCRRGGREPPWGEEPPPPLLLLPPLGSQPSCSPCSLPPARRGPLPVGTAPAWGGRRDAPRTEAARAAGGAAGEHNNKGPMEASAAVTSLAWPLDGEAIVLELSDTKAASGSPAPLPESQEEAGSGDQHAKASPDQGAFARQTAAPPAYEVATEISSPASQGLSSDSKEEPLELWVEPSSSPPAQGAAGPVTPPVDVRQTSEPPSDPSASEIIDIDYYDLFDGESQGGAGGMEDFPGAGGTGSSDSTKRKPPGDKATSWSIHELYDDFTPFDESDFYPTTSFYTDGDEEEELDEAEEEEEEEEEDGGGGLARDLEDENDYKLPTPATPKIQTMVEEAKPTSRRYVIPPLQTFIISGGNGAAASPRPPPAETGRDLSKSAAGWGENGTECRSGYIRHNSSCKSVCDIFPSYCHNGGQCYLVESLGAFCRCNTQDYIWHKGIRCESIITDFQVMCVAVGSAALVVLLLFMMTVFFAKKLYLLKTENNKLRKTKYRTPSELHNDNFSLSTIAEGSHPNVRKLCDTPCNLSPHARALAYYDNIICQDDPNAPHKLQDPLKSCLKEEESFNIQNSMSPKHDNGKGEPNDPEVNCLQNNLT